MEAREPTTAGRRPAARIAAALAVAMALSVVLASGLIRLPGVPYGSGPLGGSTTVPPEDGDRHYYGVALLPVNDSPFEIAVEDLRPITAGAGTVLVAGARAHANPADAGYILAADPEIPDGWSGSPPVRFLRIAPGGTATIMSEISVPAGSEFDITGYEVDYAVGPLHFRSFVPAGSLVFCSNDTPPEQAHRDCTDPAEALLWVLHHADSYEPGAHLVNDGTAHSLSRDPDRLRAAAAAADYSGPLARVFVVVLARDGVAPVDALVVADESSRDWRLLAPGH